MKKYIKKRKWGLNWARLACTVCVICIQAEAHNLNTSLLDRRLKIKLDCQVVQDRKCN
jgi:hypothetical protein